MLMCRRVDLDAFFLLMPPFLFRALLQAEQSRLVGFSHFLGLYIARSGPSNASHLPPLAAYGAGAVHGGALVRRARLQEVKRDLGRTTLPATYTRVWNMAKIRTAQVTKERLSPRLHGIRVRAAVLTGQPRKELVGGQRQEPEVGLWPGTAQNLELPCHRQVNRALHRI